MKIACVVTETHTPCFDQLYFLFSQVYMLLFTPVLPVKAHQGCPIAKTSTAF